MAARQPRKTAQSKGAAKGPANGRAKGSTKGSSKSSAEASAKEPAKRSAKPSRQTAARSSARSAKAAAKPAQKPKSRSEEQSGASRPSGPRAFWKGYLKLSLVTCPVAMMPATSESQRVRFHTLNRKTGNRVQSRYVDAETGKPVDEDDEVKGYETGTDDYVILEDEELDSVALESTRTIDIDVFVPRDAIEWVWYDRPHYLMPDDPVGEEAFCVIRDAMEATDKVGIARLVLYRRERAVMLEPRDRGIVLWTLRYGDEVRDPQDYFGEIEREKPDAELLSMVGKLIEERRREWSGDMIVDPVQANLKKIIASKGKAKRPAKAREPEQPSNVVNIMEALRRSVSAEREKRD
jgi:DNA end-binding protein Ku